MTYATLNAVRTATALEGPKSVAMHYFVQLASGRWTRTLGAPKDCDHVRGRVYRSRVRAECVLTNDEGTMLVRLDVERTPAQTPGLTFTKWVRKPA